MEKSEEKQTKKFVIVRTHSAGVWFGILKSLNGSMAIITEARRLYYWSGAASLSQLAEEGTKKPNDCKFAMVITGEDGVYLPQTIEVLPCTQASVENIQAVKVWKV